MLADLKQAIQTPLEFSEFLGQCEFFNHLQSAVAVVNCIGESKYENASFSSFNKYSKSTNPETNNEILRRETVIDAIAGCCSAQRATNLVENVSIDTTRSYPIHLLLQPIVSDSSASVLGVFVSIAEGSLDILQNRLSMYEKQQQHMLARIRELSNQSRSKEQLIKSLFRDTPFSIIVMDMSRRIVRINRNGEKLLGVKSARVFGETCDKYLSCFKDHGGCIACDKNTESSFHETRLYSLDGAEHDILKSTVPHTIDGESFILEAFIDITERKRLNYLEKEKEKEVLEASAKSKSNFYASLSHELRTPLNAILGYSDLVLEEPNLPEQIGHDVKNIKDAGNHLLELVTNLLDISKIDAGKLFISNESTNWRELCNDIITSIRPIAEKNGNSIEFSYPDSDGEMVVDPLRLRQIILNFLNNSCDFTKNGKISLYIKEKSASSGGLIQFTVKDTGIGIDKEKLSKIFYEYEQADRTINEDRTGTGLGLPICSRLALLMNGSITADSEENVGSTFTLELPLNTD